MQASDLNYAGPTTPARRPRGWRVALGAMIGLVATWTVDATLIYLAQKNRLPPDFLCCHHPEIAWGAFVIAPAMVAVAGVYALVQALSSHGSVKVWLVSTGCIVFGLFTAVLGVMLTMALKA
jgi:hypothetical protein